MAECARVDSDAVESWMTNYGPAIGLFGFATLKYLIDRPSLDSSAPCAEWELENHFATVIVAVELPGKMKRNNLINKRNIEQKN